MIRRPFESLTPEEQREQLLNQKYSILSKLLHKAEQFLESDKVRETIEARYLLKSSYELEQEIRLIEKPPEKPREKEVKAVETVTKHNSLFTPIKIEEAGYEEKAHTPVLKRRKRHREEDS